MSVDRSKRYEGRESLEEAYLVDKVLAVIVGELLCADDPVHVGFHKFL
jgi:hypothetical protein